MSPEFFKDDLTLSFSSAMENLNLLATVCASAEPIGHLGPVPLPSPEFVDSVLPDPAPGFSVSLPVSTASVNCSVLGSFFLFLYLPQPTPLRFDTIKKLRLSESFRSRPHSELTCKVPC